MRVKTYLSIRSVLPVIVLLLFAAGCRLCYIPIEKQPSGGVAINDTLWFDKTEICNEDWHEFSYWYRRVFQRDPRPDTNVWIRDYGYDQDTSCKTSTLHWLYLWHPAYRNHPVVGISQELAERYTIWRADRVFEQYLIFHGIVALNPLQDSINHFTIDNFFRGEYKTLKPTDTFRYYPHYRLPAPAEYLAAAAYQDSVLGAHRRWCLTKRCKMCLQYSLDERPLITEPPVFGKVTIPGYARYRRCHRYHRKMVLNVRGNVGELTSVPGVTTREIFRETVDSHDTIPHREVNSYTGFRNVMTWRLWVDHKE